MVTRCVRQTADVLSGRTMTEHERTVRSVSTYNNFNFLSQSVNLIKQPTPVDSTFEFAEMSSASSCSSASGDDSFEILKEEILTGLPNLLIKIGISHRNLRYLAAGSWHIVFAFDIVKQIEGGEESEAHASVTPAIIRIATDEEDLPGACETTLDHAAVLRFLSKHFSYTPILIGYDATTENVLQRPYTIQTRLPGKTLDDVWDELDIEAKCEIVEQLADFQIKCKEIRFPACGDLCCDDSPEGVKELKLGIREFGSRSIVRLENVTCTPEVAYKSYFLAQLPRTIEDCASVREDILPYNRAMLRDISKIFDDMETIPEYKDYLSRNVNDASLHHVDLHPGNLLVEPYTKSGETTTHWRISGIIDWDGGQALPAVQTNQAPAMLWQHRMWEEEELTGIWPGDLNHLPREWRNVFDDNGEAIKAHFDQYMKRQLTEAASSDDAFTGWCIDAYGPGLWIRRVSDFCQNGYNHEASNTIVAMELLDEWRENLHLDREFEHEQLRKKHVPRVFKQMPISREPEEPLMDVIEEIPETPVESQEIQDDSSWEEAVTIVVGDHDFEAFFRSIFWSIFFFIGASGLLTYKLQSFCGLL